MKKWILPDKNIKSQNETLGKKIPTDIITIIMITVCVWVVKSITHELFGHGVAVLLMGEKITSISTMWCHHSEITSVLGNKFVITAGSLANLILAFVSLLFLRFAKIRKPSTLFFFWLLMTINIFHAGSYMIGWFIGPTLDWAQFIDGMEPIWFWKILMTVIGTLIVLAGFHLSTKYWVQFIGNKKKLRRKRINIISVIPWVTCILVSLSGLIFFQTSQKTMMIWGAIGTSGFFLIWMLLLRFWPLNKRIDPIEILPLKRSYPWIIIGLVSLLFFIFIMGPGINFTNQY